MSPGDHDHQPSGQECHSRTESKRKRNKISIFITKKQNKSGWAAQPRHQKKIFKNGPGPVTYKLAHPTLYEVKHIGVGHHGFIAAKNTGVFHEATNHGDFISTTTDCRSRRNERNNSQETRGPLGRQPLAPN